MAKGNTGKEAAITYMVTVAPSINLRITNPPDHIEPDIVDGENTCAHDRSQQCEKAPFACYFLFRPDGESMILIHGLDNNLNRESVWWVARQAT